LTTSCELTLLYASLLEEYDCGEITFFRGICTGTCGALSTIKGDGSARSCSVWRVFRSAIHLRVTRKVEAMDERVELVQKTVRMRIIHFVPPCRRWSTVFTS
jgi:hypothetical protein